jgi:sulfotransferase
VLRLVYEFIGETWSPHDFQNVHYDAPAYDEALGLTGLHRVRPVIKLLDRRTILPPDLYEKYTALSFWRDGTGSAANVVRAKG